MDNQRKEKIILSLKLASLFFTLIGCIIIFLQNINGVYCLLISNLLFVFFCIFQRYYIFIIQTLCVSIIWFIAIFGKFINE